LATAALGLVTAQSSLALTAPALRLSDTAGNVVTIDSTGAVTFSAGCACSTQAVAVAPGTITWSGSIGNFSVSNVNGSSKPVLAFPTMDTSMGFLQAPAGGTLNVSYTDVGFAGAGPTAMTNLATIIGTGAASFTSYLDNTNVAFGTGTLIGTDLPNATIAGPGPTAALFSMTETEAFVMAPGDIFIIDDGLQATPVALSASCPAASGKAGTAYSSSVTAAGGLPPYTFVVTSGSLPAGLTLNLSTGLISGTPSASGLFSFDITVTDATGAKAIAGGCGMSIAAAGGTGQGGLTLSCPASSGQVGVAYASSPLVATGGVAPYMFSVNSGALPANVYLNASTGAFTGTPTTAGTATVVFKVTDSTKPTALTGTSSSCAITIAPAPTPICSGDGATIGFWHNKNGQALIDALNGGPTSKSLASWLASQYPYLYGANSSTNLTGKTNADVASLFLTLFGSNKIGAQILGGALADYVTSSTLGGTTAKSYGFNSSTAGTGAKSYNVGTNGTSVGLVNNQSYTVSQLLAQVNATVKNGTYNANAFNVIFSGINQTGDII
jgi:hypothetical protein